MADQPAAPAGAPLEHDERIRHLLAALDRGIADLDGTGPISAGLVAEEVAHLAAALKDLGAFDVVVGIGPPEPSGPSDIELAAADLIDRVENLTVGERGRLVEVLAGLGLVNAFNRLDPVE